MVLDNAMPTYKSKRFIKCDWSEFYPKAVEAIPNNMPQPRVKEVCMSCFFDADHAGCREICRSHSGIIIFVNRAPILWFSKRQNTRRLELGPGVTCNADRDQNDRGIEMQVANDGRSYPR